MNLSLSQSAALAALLMLSFSGCDKSCKELAEEIKQLKEYTIPFAELNSRLPPLVFPGPTSPPTGDPLPAAVVAADAQAPRPRLILKAIKDAEKSSYLTFPNKSYGPVAAQVSVSAMKLVGLQSGESMGFLEWRQPQATGGPRRFSLVAVFDPVAVGLRAKVIDPVSGAEFGTPIFFAGKAEIDLRIDVTATEMTFSARETPEVQGPGGWQTVHTEPLALDPAYWRVYVGARKVGRGGAWGFTRFAMDGEAVGGTHEYPVIAKVRSSTDAIRAAQEKLRVEAPDLTAVVTDLDDALERNEEAVTALDNTFFLMQSVTDAQIAQTTLGKVRAGLVAAIAAGESGDPKKARAQITKLDALALSQSQAMGNLLGWSMPKMKSIPELFSLHLP